MDPLTLELLAWISSRPRSYPDAMEAWRSNCPRHSVWEDAIIAGLIQIERGRTLSDSRLTLTARGRAMLDTKGSAEG